MQTQLRKQVRHIAPNQGSSHRVLGVDVREILGATDTAGQLYLAENIVSPGGGPPPHVHSREDELFYVLEGTLDVLLGGRTYRAAAGSLAYLPRGIAHAFGNSADRPTRFLLGIIPPDFAGFFTEANWRERQPGFLPEDILSLGVAYGLDFTPEQTARCLGPNEYGQLGLISGPDEGAIMPYMGGSVNIKLKRGDTRGTLASVEATIPPGGGPPLHFHRGFDEIFFILEGEFVFRADGKDYYAMPGTTIYVPQGVPHQFLNVGDRPARMIGFLTPGGFEEWFIRISALETSGTLTYETAAAIAAEMDSTAVMNQPQLSQLTADAIAELRSRLD